ncbi:MAG: UvrD-helicase domain-containing protein [Cyclobacteriaceae bacterium]|nr:UvrD-helicase domain-containing protein [Cyclobacteriaceae bacterium]MCH8515990.1 UvrD-helicase domain-containing protein [Cyclobacteriaceae bacterium]
MSHQQAPLLIYNASAGSGKTFTLAKEYIRMALEGGFSSILAVTFTNKAAEEIKKRIAEELIAEYRTAGSSSVIQSLYHDYPEKKPFYAAGIGPLAKKLLHSYSQFAVSTIDSFFQRLLRAFALEMDLNGNYKLDLNFDKAKDYAADLLTQSIGKKEERIVSKWLLELAKEQIANEKSWEITKILLDSAQLLSYDRFQEVRNSASFQELQSEDFSQIKKELRALTQKAEIATLNHARALYEDLFASGLKLDNLAGGNARGAARFFHQVGMTKPLKENEAFSQIAWDYILDSSKTFDKWFKKAVHAEAETWHAEQESTGSLSQLRQAYSKIKVSELLQKKINTIGLSQKLNAAIEQYRQENNTLFNFDTVRLLSELVEEDKGYLVYEKMGMKYNHYLIDEFQDTSSSQWAAFKPLIENSIAEQNQNILVGDVKQSIYRWRGGDPNLLLSKVANEGGIIGHTQSKNLDVNYRSARQVIAFNNTLFSLVPKIGHDLMTTKYGFDQEVYLDLFTSTYHSAPQMLGPKATKEDHGYVEIHAMEYKRNTHSEAEDETTQQEQVLEYYYLKYLRLLKEGFQPNEITFLVRSNRQSEVIINYFQQRALAEGQNHIRLISSTGMGINQAATVGAIVASLRYLNKPNDMSLQFTAKHLLAEVSPIFSSEQTNEALTMLQKVLEEKSRENFYELSRSLIEAFELQQSDEKAYLQAFLDIIIHYAQNNEADLHQFLRYWDEEGFEKSIVIPENPDASTVVTVHKSKGLQYRVVMIPFLDWGIYTHIAHSDRWVEVPEEVKLAYNLPEKLPEYWLVPTSGDGVSSPFGKEVQMQYVESMIDELNSLYVALTRAEERIYAHAIYDIPKTTAPTPKIGHLIYQSLAVPHTVSLADQYPSVNFNDHIEQLEGESGEKILRLALGIESPPHSSQKEKDKKDDRLQMIFHDWSKKLKIKFSEHDLGILQDEERKNQILFGTYLHEVLSKCRYEQDKEKALQEMQISGLLDEDQKLKIRDQIDRLFKNEQIRSWFSKDWQVKTEASILKSGVREFIPDRVCTRKMEEAIVIDYKSGQKTESHKIQLLGYKKLLKEMGYEKVSAFLLYTERVEIVSV